MLLSLLLSLACAPKIGNIETLFGDAEDGHYLVVSDEGEVFDCLSRPDGQRWDPTCVLVEFHNSYTPRSSDPEKKKD